MKSNIPQILFLIFGATVFCLAQSNSWNNLTPLHSTRADVEKLLGKPKDNTCNFGCEYETSKEKIRVAYAYKKCDKDGWNVPSDTVLSISIIPKTEERFSELKTSKENLLTLSTSPNQKYYVNQKMGVAYEVNPFEVLRSINYYPTESNNNLRCAGFPSYNPIGSMYFPDYSFSQKDLQKAKATLDSFIIKSINEKENSKGYVIVYSGKNISEKEYKRFLNSLKNHAYKTRKVDPASFEIIDGGNSISFHIDVFFINKNYPSPVPSP